MAEAALGPGKQRTRQYGFKFPSTTNRDFGRGCDIKHFRPALFECATRLFPK